MPSRLLACVFLLAFLPLAPAHAITLVYPEVYKFTGNISCPDKYPIKTGETSGGTYFTSCWSELAWSFYMAGGDEWVTWTSGEYVPVPTPTPTITVTPEPVVHTRTVTNTVTEPCPAAAAAPESRLEVRRAMRQKMKEVRALRAQLRDMRSLRR